MGADGEQMGIGALRLPSLGGGGKVSLSSGLRGAEMIEAVHTFLIRGKKKIPPGFPTQAGGGNGLPFPLERRPGKILHGRKQEELIGSLYGGEGKLSCLV